MRPDWLGRVVSECQGLVNPAAQADPSVVARRLDEFVQSLPCARSFPEKLVLRGLLLEVYVQLDTWLGRLGVDAAVRERGRQCWLHDGHRTSRPELIFQQAYGPLIESWRDLIQLPDS